MNKPPHVIRCDQTDWLQRIKDADGGNLLLGCDWMVKCDVIGWWTVESQVSVQLPHDEGEDLTCSPVPQVFVWRTQGVGPLMRDVSVKLNGLIWARQTDLSSVGRRDLSWLTDVWTLQWISFLSVNGLKSFISSSSSESITAAHTFHLRDDILSLTWLCSTWHQSLHLHPEWTHQWHLVYKRVNCVTFSSARS